MEEYAVGHDEALVAAGNRATCGLWGEAGPGKIGIELSARK